MNINGASSNTIVGNNLSRSNLAAKSIPIRDSLLIEQVGEQTKVQPFDNLKPNRVIEINPRDSKVAGLVNDKPGQESSVKNNQPKAGPKEFKTSPNLESKIIKLKSSVHTSGNSKNQKANPSLDQYLDTENLFSREALESLVSVDIFV